MLLADRLSEELTGLLEVIRRTVQIPLVRVEPTPTLQSQQCCQ